MKAAASGSPENKSTPRYPIPYAHPIPRRFHHQSQWGTATASPLFSPMKVCKQEDLVSTVSAWPLGGDKRGEHLENSRNGHGNPNLELRS